MMKPKKQTQEPISKKRPCRRPEMSPERAKLVDEMVEQLRRVRDERVGPNATFEQQSDASFEIVQDVLRKDEEDKLRSR